MSQKNGLVMKIRHRCCIVLTPEGEFIKVPLSGRHVHIGEEIVFDQPRPMNMLIKPLLVAASILLLFVVGQIYPGPTPSASASAYVSLDINPSIELAVDNKNIVIDARGLNKVGEQLLKQVNVLNHDIYGAVELVVSEAIKVRYLQPNRENVVLTTVTVVENKSPVIDQKRVYQAIEKPLQNNNLQADVVIEPVTTEFRTEANKAGLSSGRYLLYQQSKEKGLPVSVEELKNSGISQLQKENKVNIKELVPGRGYKNKHSGEQKNQEKTYGKQEQIQKTQVKVEITPVRQDSNPFKDSGHYIYPGSRGISNSNAESRKNPEKIIKTPQGNWKRYDEKDKGYGDEERGKYNVNNREEKRLLDRNNNREFVEKNFINNINKRKERDLKQDIHYERKDYSNGYYNRKGRCEYKINSRFLIDIYSS
ncbi:anti-sigma factor domain-containing protein [Desulfolucanica intricata]|uniref:anti-sigma factor domain-containing protein n=1 Tax=Desulfolucanica intricata TaxID=1285191 RepID=UPI0008325CD0|nr:anti-sigma factor domain-containing protein [Desulfolucanica intricata]